MKVLDVWFYPRSKERDEALVVGRVVCGEDAVVIEMVDRADTVAPFDPTAWQAKLDFLVRRAEAPYEELAGLESDYWAFVPGDVGVRR